MRIGKALVSLGIKDFVLRGEPTTEEQFKAMFRKVTGVDKNGSAIESADPSHWGTTWEKISAEKKRLQDAEPMRLLRVERNKRLAETDWMASSDLTMSDAWKKYRQDLRDITKTATSLDDAKFPTKPS